MAGRFQGTAQAASPPCSAAAFYGLWICDVFFAYEALEAWLGVKGEMVSAVSFGYALESPAPRPRKALADVLEWRE